MAEGTRGDMPMKFWEEAICKSIESLGGEADLQEIYRSLRDRGALTERNGRETRWGGRPAYHHVVRSYISNMCRSGLLRRIGRARYKIVEYVARE